ncbi:hypothetical protein G7054_g7177 [Neopestalotiopsis clavispora]|nr:hypothetical protein G7054_g7177 [Neopestalotiopsis clavispora]
MPVVVGKPAASRKKVARYAAEPPEAPKGRLLIILPHLSGIHWVLVMADPWLARRAQTAPAALTDAGTAAASIAAASTGNVATSSAPSSQPPGLLRFPTDRLCPRILVEEMLQDYLIHIYPLIPVVHRPTFRRDILQGRDCRDDVFLGFILALCAIVVSLMPSKFEAYLKSDPPMPFASRAEMINRCHDMIMALRGPTYFDQINFQKFAIAYLLNISFFQLGEQNRSRMMECEGMQLGRLLNLHKSSEEDGLNFIEVQLRRKGFWLLYYGYVHSQLQNLRKEKLTFLDPVLMQSVDLCALLPKDVEDEFILEDAILEANPTDTFHSKVFGAALGPWALAGDTRRSELCQCQRASNKVGNVTYLHERLYELKYALDIIPSPLRQWAQATNPPSNRDGAASLAADLEEHVVQIQFATMRANLHVTHLWLQSIIIDQLDAMEGTDTSDNRTRRLLWDQREEICRQLLHVLHTIPESALEPNGLHLAFKVRDVAVGMLACPYGDEELASRRAAEYVRELTAILSRLDRSERVNTTNSQSWVDTDRIKDFQASDIFPFGDW